jgi:hypothetical protein
MGMGFSHYLMTNYFNAINPADFSLAIDDPRYNLQWDGNVQPDYIFFNEITGEKFIVECKGTQTSRTTSIKQLRRGLEQVWSVQPNDGKALTRIIIAACLLDKKTMIYILDPPSEESEKSDYDENSQFKNLERVLEIEGKTFRRNVRLIARAKVLTYAGLDNDAQKIIPEHIKKGIRNLYSPMGVHETIETMLGDFEGTSISLNYRDGTEINIFKGISVKNKDYYLENNITRDESSEIDISPFYEDNNSIFKDKKHWTRSDSEQTSLKVQSVCREGTILQITIRGLDS